MYFYIYFVYLFSVNKAKVKGRKVVERMTARPLVRVYNEKADATTTEIKLPGVFRAPLRPDIVSFIHDQMRKNKRQPYAVSTEAGSFSFSYFSLLITFVLWVSRAIFSTPDHQFIFQAFHFTT